MINIFQDDDGRYGVSYRGNSIGYRILIEDLSNRSEAERYKILFDKVSRITEIEIAGKIDCLAMEIRKNAG